MAFAANPHHRRAQLVVLTDKGRSTYEAAMRLQVPWVNGLAAGLTAKDMAIAHRVIEALRHELEGNDEAEDRA